MKAKNLVKTFLVSYLISTLFTNKVLAKDNQVDGHWEGSISISGVKLKIQLDINTDNNTPALIKIPEQTKKELKLDNFNKKDKKVHFELSVSNKAIFDGNIISENHIEGEFLQSGMTGTFVLNRIPLSKVMPSKEIEEKLPYKQEDITFKNGDITLAGTLTLPDKEKDFPSVILITGSGPQNRDEEIFGFKIFKIIADHLTRNGIAVLRVDDRGVGESTGSMADATTQDFATDVEAGITFLKTRKEINAKKIGLIGHSEGGIIAPMVAVRNKDVSFIILLSGPSFNGEDIILSQSALISRAEGISEEDITSSLNIDKECFTLLRQNASKEKWDELENKLKKIFLQSIDRMSEQEKKQIKDTKQYSEINAKLTIAKINNKWMKFFIEYEPSVALEKLQTPILALFGEKDLQVPSKENKSKMDGIFSKSGYKNYKSIIFPKANHLFQEAKTGSPTEYDKLDKKFVSGLLELITQWIKEVK